MGYPTYVLEVIGDNVSKFEEIMSVLDETRPEKKGEGNYKLALAMFKGHQKIQEKVAKRRIEIDAIHTAILEKKKIV
jgi:predicted AAA+ superfamily ATPase